MKNTTAAVVAAVVLAVALVLSAWMTAQGRIVSAYVMAHEETGAAGEHCPVPEPSSLAPLLGVDY